MLSTSTWLRSLRPVTRRVLSSQAAIREQVHPTVQGRRRFYKHVAVRVVPSSDGNDGLEKYEITLDGRPLRTPGRRDMHFTSKALAMAIGLEWDSQGAEGIQPSTMPLMSLTATWLDQTAQTPDIVVRNTMKYLATDTCCFFAERNRATRELARRQDKHFTKIHDWLIDEWDIELATTNGISKIAHPTRSVNRLEAIVNSLDYPALTALQCATMESKSLAIGLALVLRHITPEVAQELSRLEEEFQMEKWGLVEGGHDLDRAAAKVQLTSTAAFMNLLDGLEGHKARINMLQGELTAWA